MNDAPSTSQPAPAPSCYAVRARARRAEDEYQAEVAGLADGARCVDCALPATVGHRTHPYSPPRCDVCAAVHARKVRGAFGGL